MDDMQQKVDRNEDNADLEYKALTKLGVRIWVAVISRTNLNIII
jgi:hypothetical protein